MTLKEYLIKLSEDPATLKSLRENPKAALAASGLSKEEQEILTRANPAELREHLTGRAGPGGRVVVVVTIVVVGPSLPPPVER
jgi:hypothetical protein